MKRERRHGFTLIEMLVVIAVILILASIAFPLIGDALRWADVVKCQSNLKQIGIWVLGEAMRFGQYPRGGLSRNSPGQWPSVFASMKKGLRGISEIGKCPSVKENSPIAPSQQPGTDDWATCSYAYIGYFSPTYTCNCGSCGSDGKEIWSARWSGVEYTGGHDRADHSEYKNFPLADNLVFNKDRIDTGETGYGEGDPQPTVPEHQDTDKFSTSDIIKDRSLRALRAVPETPEDNKGSLPLLMDIVVMKARTDLGAPNWQKAHTYISTETQKRDLLFANHCSTSATGKRGWGINIFYTNGRIEWKLWEDLRFQLSVPDASGSNYRYYFF